MLWNNLLLFVSLWLLLRKIYLLPITSRIYRSNRLSKLWLRFDKRKVFSILWRFLLLNILCLSLLCNLFLFNLSLIILDIRLCLSSNFNNVFAIFLKLFSLHLLAIRTRVLSLYSQSFICLNFFGIPILFNWIYFIFVFYQHFL